jgi:hypothetical protein
VERSLTEVLAGAARDAREASDWERDQHAWNLPRARGETNARSADMDENDARKSDSDEPEEPPATSREQSG